MQPSSPRGRGPPVPNEERLGSRGEDAGFQGEVTHANSAQATQQMLLSMAATLEKLMSSVAKLEARQNDAEQKLGVRPASGLLHHALARPATAAVATRPPSASRLRGSTSDGSSTPSSEAKSSGCEDRPSSSAAGSVSPNLPGRADTLEDASSSLLPLASEEEGHILLHPPDALPGRAKAPSLKATPPSSRPPSTGIPTTSQGKGEGSEENGMPVCAGSGEDKDTAHSSGQGNTDKASSSGTSNEEGSKGSAQMGGVARESEPGTKSSSKVSNSSSKQGAQAGQPGAAGTERARASEGGGASESAQGQAEGAGNGAPAADPRGKSPSRVSLPPLRPPALKQPSPEPSPLDQYTPDALDRPSYKATRFSNQDQVKLLEESCHEVVKPSMQSDTSQVLASLKAELKVRDSLQHQHQAKGSFWQVAASKLKYYFWEVLSPSDPIRTLWDSLNVFAILFAVILTPFIVAFQIDTSKLDSGIAIVDMMVNVFFMADVILTFRTAYISDEGDVVFDRLRIAGRYLMFWFWIDSVASIPWDLALTSETNLLMLLRLTRTTRVIRVLHTLRALRMVKLFRIGQVFEWFQEQLGRQRLSITYFVVTVACCLHWASCLYHFLASINDFAEDTWVVRAGIEDESSAYRYISSLYWAITTMTTVGYGDITAVRVEEKIVASLVMVAGSSMFAYMMGSVATLIANSNELQARMTRRMFAIDRFVRTRRIPPVLASKLRAFYAYRMERETQLEENDILMGLTDSLRSQLTLYVYKDLLEKIPFFQGKAASFITSIVPHLTPVYASPGDVIVFQGEKGHEMFFLLEGSLEARLYSDADPFLAQSKGMVDSFIKAGPSFSKARSEASFSRGSARTAESEEEEEGQQRRASFSRSKASIARKSRPLNRGLSSCRKEGLPRLVSSSESEAERPALPPPRPLRKNATLRRTYVDSEDFHSAGGGKHRPGPVSEALLPHEGAGGADAAGQEEEEEEEQQEGSSMSGEWLSPRPPLYPSPLPLWPPPPSAASFPAECLPPFQHLSVPRQGSSACASPPLHHHPRHHSMLLSAQAWQPPLHPTPWPSAPPPRHWPFRQQDWRPWAGAQVHPSGWCASGGLPPILSHPVAEGFQQQQGAHKSLDTEGKLSTHASGSGFSKPSYADLANSSKSFNARGRGQVQQSRMAERNMEEISGLARREQSQIFGGGMGVAASAMQNFSPSVQPSGRSQPSPTVQQGGYDRMARDRARAAIIEGFKAPDTLQHRPSGFKLPQILGSNRGKKALPEDAPPKLAPRPSGASPVADDAPPHAGHDHGPSPTAGPVLSSHLLPRLSGNRDATIGPGRKREPCLPQLEREAAAALEPREEGFPPAVTHESKYILLNHYKPGDNFGEMACLKGRPHPATVVAVDLCYMYCLQREDLESVLELWPEMRHELDRMVLTGKNSLLRSRMQHHS